MKGTLCFTLIAVCLLAIPAFAANPIPKVTIVSPEEGLTIASQVVAVEASYAAAGKAVIEQVDLAIDGVTVDARVLDPATAKGRASFTWVARNYADGEHTIGVRALDSKGGMGEAEITVTLHGAQRSIIGITSPKPGENVSGSTTIEVDADPTLARYVIFLVDDVFKAMTNVRPFSYVWDTTRYLNGKHILQARAYLADDREVSSSAVEVDVNNPSGATGMRTPAPKPQATVTPAPLAPPARAAEPTLPPPMRTESPTPAQPPLSVSQPDLAVPGTAPFVSASGDLIQPPIPVLAGKSSEPALIEVAALPAPVESAPVVEALATEVAAVHTPEAATSTASSADALAVAAHEAATAPLEVAMLDIPGAATPAASDLSPVTSLEAAAPPQPPTPAPLEVAAPEAPAPEPVALPSAEVSPEEAGIEPAAATEAQPVDSSVPAASELKIAMLPPMPVEPMPAPRVAAEPAPSAVIYTVRGSESLARIAAEVGLPATEIARANNLTGTEVHAGQRLVLPSCPIYLDHKPLTADAPTVIAGGRAIVPFRAVMEEAGGQVSWDSSARRASAIARGHEIAVTIGSDRALVDDGEVVMGAAAELRCNRTVVPLRFLGDALDLVLQYQDGVIHIASAH